MNTDLRIISTVFGTHYIVGPKDGSAHSTPFLPVFGGIPGFTDLGTDDERRAQRELNRLQVLESKSLLA